MEMLVDVASRGEATGYEVTCLIVAAKDSLDPDLSVIQDSTRVLILECVHLNIFGLPLSCYNFFGSNLSFTDESRSLSPKNPSSLYPLM